MKKCAGTHLQLSLGTWTVLHLLLVTHVITGGDCAARDNLFLFVTLSAFAFLPLFFNESLSEVG